MQAVARLERQDARNRRTAARRRLTLGAVLSDKGDKAVIHDLSSTGILIETGADLATFEQVQIDLPEVGSRVATVIWNSGQYFGCEFHEPIPQAAISAALLRNPILASAIPDATAGEESDEAAAADDRYPLPVRLRVIIGISLALWALILRAAISL